MLLNFSINLAKAKLKPKKPKIKKEGIKISRLCLAEVVKDKGVYKAKVNMLNDPDTPDYLLIEFTEESLKLNDKHIIYLKKRDKRGNIVKIIRDDNHLSLWHPDENLYSSVHEGVCVSGNIVKVNDIYKFKLNKIHGTVNHIIDVPSSLDVDRPLFNK